jgi:S-adenosylmethionine:tRNA-ribosyltransferase-isomerase (queuine synthetase)
MIRFTQIMEQHLKAMEAVKATGRVDRNDAVSAIKVLVELGHMDTYLYLTDDRGRADRKRYHELLENMDKML